MTSKMSEHPSFLRRSYRRQLLTKRVSKSYFGGIIRWSITKLHVPRSLLSLLGFMSFSAVNVRTPSRSIKYITMLANSTLVEEGEVRRKFLQHMMHISGEKVTVRSTWSPFVFFFSPQNEAYYARGSKKCQVWYVKHPRQQHGSGAKKWIYYRRTTTPKLYVEKTNREYSSAKKCVVSQRRIG